MRAVTVELPVYGARTRSLRKAFVHRGTGGLVRADGATLTVRALDDVSLSFGDGDRVGVLGANGAGKTTLLRVLAGVYEPTAGEVWAAGRIGSLLDVTLGFDEEATGRETIVTCGLLAGLTLAEVRDRAAEIGEFTGLGDYLGMPVHAYSTGMRFRLGFAVCTSFEPDIVLIDEWTAVGTGRSSTRRTGAWRRSPTAQASWCWSRRIGSCCCACARRRSCSMRGGCGRAERWRRC